MASLKSPLNAAPASPLDVVLHGVVRRRDGLFAWVTQTADDGSIGTPACIALSTLPASLYPQRDALLADWESLHPTTDLASVWPAFWRVFWHTVTELREQSAVTASINVAPPAKPAASAAHPRAFRGTKFAPPKPALPVFDLRAWLGDDRLLDGFFSQHNFESLPGFDAHGLPSLKGFKPGQAPTTSDLLVCLGENGQRPQLPDTFRRLFLWHFKDRPHGDLLAWLQLWRALGSAAQGEQLALLARLCALAPGAHAWSKLALSLAPERQMVFLATVLEQRAYLLPPTALSVHQLATLVTETPDERRFAACLTAVLSNLERGGSAAYTLLGCALVNRHGETNTDQLRSSLLASKHCDTVRMEDITRMEAALGEHYRHWGVSAWCYCGLLPGFDQVIRGTSWEKLDAAAAERWLALFTQTLWAGEQEPGTEGQWQAHLVLFKRWQSALATVAKPWQLKFVSMLVEHTDGWTDVERLKKCSIALLPLQLRLCAPPYSTMQSGAWVLSSMTINLKEPGWQTLIDASERHWLSVERACRRDNDRGLIRRGLYGLSMRWPDFALRAFSAAPRRLLRTARLLGCLSYARRLHFLGQTSQHAWFSSDWESMAPVEACKAINLLCRETGVSSPLPRRLREYLEGQLTLSAQQIERHCRIALQRLPYALLEALERQIWSSIDAPFNMRAKSIAANHAVRLLAGLEYNRKALRRFLLDYSQGRERVYLDHPLNRAWLARHPRIDAAIWLGAQRGTQRQEKGICIDIETDPLEVLMLGTYVGSCLGLGGMMEDSAVACLLDANKQVVYARDQEGRVLARQLLAIDELERLVCFDIYPVSADAALRAAFRAHNIALAHALGIAIYTEQMDEHYRVPVILAQTWWDDGVNDTIVDQAIGPTSIPS